MLMVRYRDASMPAWVSAPAVSAPRSPPAMTAFRSQGTAAACSYMLATSAPWSMLRSAVQIITASLRLLASRASSPVRGPAFVSQARLGAVKRTRHDPASLSAPGSAPAVPSVSLVRLACLLVIAGPLRGPFRLRGFPDLIERRHGLPQFPVGVEQRVRGVQAIDVGLGLRPPIRRRPLSLPRGLNRLA